MLGRSITSLARQVAHHHTDEDGSLKIKEIEEFADSKTFLDFLNDIAEAKAAGRHSASFAA